MWAIAVLASLAVLLVFLLCVPVDMVLHLDKNGRPRLRLRLSWLFGLVSKEITRGKKQPKEKKAKDKQERGKSRQGRRFIFQILGTKGLLQQFKNLIKGMLSRLKIRNLAVNLKVGLDDPADTGLLFAVIGPIVSFLPYDITVQPSFTGEATWEGYSRGKIRIRPIQLIPPLLKFIFSPATIRAIKTVVTDKWKRKK